jgi:uncharacterized membrane protein YhdT
MPAPKKELPPEAGYPGLPINDDIPELKKAFTFFNECIRPRREFVVDESSEKGGEWRKLEFGKEGGELFPVWTTTPWDLREFGLGVAMYFQTLQLLCVTFFLCGLFQAQAISFYKSAQYSDGQSGVTGMLRGSAVCTRHEVVCLDEECANVGQTNLCNLGTVQAGLDFTMTVMLLILFMIVSMVQNNVSAALDESIQTAQDYSVMVDDPGPEDSDPDAWAKFFSQFGHVTFVTVAKDNGPLVKAMAERRAIMREIIMMIGNGNPSTEEDDDGILDTTWGPDHLDFKTKINEVSDSQRTDPTTREDKIRALIMKTGAFGMKPMAKWKDALAKVNAKIQAALNPEKKYVPSKIFITFETEIAQRKCLKALSQGTLTAAFDMGKDKIDKKYIFGDNVLAVKEAPEPNEVFYEDVDVNFKVRLKQQGMTFLITVLLVVGSVLACKLLQMSCGAGGAALWISLTNILIPIILRYLVTTIEDHVSLNDQQLSLFNKLTFFRWMNTAVVIYLITHFNEFLSDKTLKQVQAVIFADAVTTPIIRTLNPSDLINQLIICNYALTQEKMNSYFLGTVWFAAERYADMTKTLFLALFYSALFPAGLFLTALGYGFCYTVDKYSLLRSWRTPAELDDDITKISRSHMIFAVYCHAFMTMVFYAEFPFDGLCRGKGYLDWWHYRDAKALYNVTTDELYQPCDQVALDHAMVVLFGGALTRDSMNGKQERIVKVYASLVMVLSIVLFLAFFAKGIIMFVYHLFNGAYDADTKPNQEHFTSCDIQAYIPLITHPSLAYPLITANVEQFDSKYLPFELPREEDYLVQSLFNRTELPGYTDEEMAELFSEVRYYEPPAGLVEEPDVEEESVQENEENGEGEESPKKKRGWFLGYRKKKKDDYEEVGTEEEP